jgi:hypothetical protein
MTLTISKNKLDEFNHVFTAACRRANIYPLLPVTFVNQQPLGFQRYEVDPKDGKVILRAGRRMMTDKDLFG